MGKKDIAKRDAEPKTTNAELSEDELEDVSGGLGVVANEEIVLKCGKAALRKQ